MNKNFVRLLIAMLFLSILLVHFYCSKKDQQESKKEDIAQNETISAVKPPATDSAGGIGAAALTGSSQRPHFADQ